MTAGLVSRLLALHLARPKNCITLINSKGQWHCQFSEQAGEGVWKMQHVSDTAASPGDAHQPSIKSSHGGFGRRTNACQTLPFSERKRAFAEPKRARPRALRSVVFETCCRETLISTHSLGLLADPGSCNMEPAMPMIGNGLDLCLTPVSACHPANCTVWTQTKKRFDFPSMVQSHSTPALV
jgi:hypothetical protein